MQNLQPALELEIFCFLGICSVPSMGLGLNLLVSIICCCFLIAALNGSSGNSSTEILLCFSLSSLLPPVSALFHPDHMGSPLSAWSSVSWPFVAGCRSQVSPCIYDQPGEGMWKSRLAFRRCLVSVACGSWGKEQHFCCVMAKHDLQAAEHSCILLLVSSLHLLGACVSCDGWPFLLDLCLQVGFPSKADSPSCEYSRFDFDSDEDFNAFFNCKLPWPFVQSVVCPSFLLLVTGWAWSLPDWLGSFRLFLNFLSLDLGVN